MATHTHARRLLVLLAAVVLASVVAFLAYASQYYHADEDARAALVADEVQVSRFEEGWFFDGPSTDAALVFYPGAKVEETAYAPLLHALSRQDMDVFLIKAPLHFAFFDINAAKHVAGRYDYEHWYVGGHSLGGAMAASYAARHGDSLDGVILLAAYATSPLDADLTEIVLYGSQDTVLNREKVEKGRQFAPDDYVEQEIEGGNHAQFGNYGAQDGDGDATITSQEQQAQTVRLITEALGD